MFKIILIPKIARKLNTISSTKINIQMCNVRFKPPKLTLISINFLSVRIFSVNFLTHNVNFLRTGQRCAGAGVQESTPAGVGFFQQDPEQDQEWYFQLEQEPEQE